jgi:NAD(P)-dependent dehydrogenase (short-subunit alcohol dehydrogenase family)
MTSTALITGATSGIGAAIATRLANDGFRIAVSGRNEMRGTTVVDTIRADGGDAVFVPADLAIPGEGAGLAVRASEALGGQVDVLINNAGIYRFAPVAELAAGDAEEMIRTNVLAVQELVTALAPDMVARGSGTIINISSMMANKSIVGSAFYGATKAAIDLLTGGWAMELGPHGVRVNAVSPGPIHTGGTVDFDDFIDQLGDGLPSRRAGQPEDIAAAVAFLVSEEAAFVQGTTLGVDGGGRAV